ncbi:MAG TPA: nuclear transport factor 2 family protein [Thermoanaerobaculia bacterium]|jgi:ketosteroid isomerase-like protein
MPSRFVAVFAVVTTLAGAACATTPCRELDEKSEALVATANKGDVETLVRRFYAAEPIIAFAGQGITRSREEARDKWRAMLERGTFELTTEKSEESGDLYVQMGRWKLRVLAGPGDFREEDGGYFAVWKRERGEWRVTMQSFAPEGFREND